MHPQSKQSTQPRSRAIDPALLDQITGDEALAWANAWSADTEASLTAPGSPLAEEAARLRSDIRAALDTDARIPYVMRRGDFLYNFWRDASRPRGVWRRTTLPEFLAPETEWEELLSVDTLARAEGEDWVWKGATVLPLTQDRALLRLSRGGADAVTIREFDLHTRAFVANGFRIDEAKTDVSWVDRDTLLVGTDLGEDSLTHSGYPAQVRRWHRGTPLAQAEEIFRGEASDVAVGASYDPTPGYERTVITRALDFYTSRTWVDGQELDLPLDCSAVPYKQWLFIIPRTDYQPASATIPAGALAVTDLERFLAGERDFRVLSDLSDSGAVEDLSLTANYAFVTTLDNVSTRIERIALGTWERTDVPLPPASAAHIVATSPLDGDEVWLNTSSFSTPSTLSLLDATAPDHPNAAKHAPALFDLSDTAGLETRQHWATSADGTRIPYYITGDFSRGPRPTLVGGYGGFEVSLTPSFSNVRGIAWLSKGYFYVQPNLRGGGEFGPSWHSQAVKANRHKVWEDHRAVLEDIVARGYATPERIAIRGGSNGGLLTSGALTQYPDRFGAAVVQVPLTDMLRYHTLSAGASWMAEYGDPDDPAERAFIETWSPLHNVASAPAYPPALVTTSTRDDRVHPAHARTFALALWEAGQPVDYFENTVGGHAGAADNEQVARVEAMIYTWLERQIGDTATAERTQ